MTNTLYRSCLAYIFAIMLISIRSFGQNYEKEYISLMGKKDTAAVKALLTKWEHSKPGDPELYIAWFNYHLQNAAHDIISLDRNRKNDDAFEMKDTGGGKTVGYLQSAIAYTGSPAEQAISYIDRGIKLHPDRLDMRFGKIYFLGLMEKYEDFTNEVKAAISHGTLIRNKWIWKENKPPKGNPEEFFKSSIQDYVQTLYKAGDQYLPLMRDIAETMLKYYPNHVESLSNIAITYMVQGDVDKGLPYLLKAEKITPKDVIVLNNIAEAYARKKDKTNARLYYNKMKQAGTQEDIDYANEQLKKLD